MSQSTDVKKEKYFATLCLGSSGGAKPVYARYCLYLYKNEVLVLSCTYIVSIIDSIRSWP